MVLESEALHAGRIAFIRGQRSDPLPQGPGAGGMNVTLHGMNMTSPNGQQLLAVNRQMGHGVDRLQRLCSIEYLQRYFAFVLRRVKLNLGTVLTDASMGGAALVDYTRGLLTEYKGFVPAGATLSQTGDLANLAKGVAGVENCGVFARDIHPFLRGKCGKKGLVEIQASSGKRPSARVSRALGDQYAFAALDRRLAKLGLHDWRPDGIVLSKDHAGPDDSADATFDASLGQLFNVVIQGPAITTNYVGDFKLQAMPGDRVFVLMICDVLFKKDVFENDRKASDDIESIDEAALEKAYEERETALNTFDYDAWRTLALETSTAGQDDLLCNFRLQVATSAQMINYSGVDTRRYGEHLKATQTYADNRAIAAAAAKAAADTEVVTDTATRDAARAERDTARAAVVNAEAAVAAAAPGGGAGLIAAQAALATAQTELVAKQAALNAAESELAKKTAVFTAADAAADAAADDVVTATTEETNATTAKTAADAAVNAGTPNNTSSIPTSQRMGLRLGESMGEYIVGKISHLQLSVSSASWPLLPTTFTLDRWLVNGHGPRLGRVASRPAWAVCVQAGPVDVRVQCRNKC